MPRSRASSAPARPAMGLSVGTSGVCPWRRCVAVRRVPALGSQRCDSRGRPIEGTQCGDPSGLPRGDSRSRARRTSRTCRSRGPLLRAFAAPSREAGQLCVRRSMPWLTVTLPGGSSLSSRQVSSWGVTVAPGGLTHRRPGSPLGVCVLARGGIRVPPGTATKRAGNGGPQREGQALGRSVEYGNPATYRARGQEWRGRLGSRKQNVRDKARVPSRASRATIATPCLA